MAILIKSLFKEKSTRILFGSNEQRKVRKHTMSGRAYQVETTDLVGDAHGALVVAFWHRVIDNHIVILG